MIGRIPRICLGIQGLVLLILGCVLFATKVSGQVERENEDRGANVTEADYYTMVPIIHPGAMQAMQSEHGYQNAPFGYRPGSATRSNSCQTVRAVPASFRSSRVFKPRGLGYFYRKYTEAYGIPVLSSAAVDDNALRRACYTLRFLLASHSRVRNSFYRLSGRVAVIGRREGTTHIPEHGHLPAWWNQRARGLGATPHAPVSSGGEENVLCLREDRYTHDIFLHESAHGVHLLGAAYGIRGWDARLRQLYASAKRRGLWANTYSMSTPEEYFAEAATAYFYVQQYSARPDGVRGPINTREKLARYDPALYNMVKQVFPCPNTYLKRCESTRARENAQNLRMDCDLTTGGTGGGGTGGGGVTTTGGGGACEDGNARCSQWARQGECDKNPSYMLVSCKKSCKKCTETLVTTAAPTSGPVTAAPTSGPVTGGPVTGDCEDSNTQCAAWAERGECDANPDWMPQNCKKSCGNCIPPTTFTTTISPATTRTTAATTAAPTTAGATTAGPVTTPSGASTTSYGPPGTDAPTASTAAPACEDTHRHCASWAARNGCSLNPEWMHPNCRKSCNKCGANAADNVCTDNNTNCEYWANTGQCNNNPAYMRRYCRMSCELC